MTYTTMTNEELVSKGLEMFQSRNMLDTQLELIKKELRQRAIRQEAQDNSVTFHGPQGHILVTFQNPRLQVKDLSLVPQEYKVSKVSTILDNTKTQKLREEVIKGTVQGVLLTVGTPRVGFRPGEKNV